MILSIESLTKDYTGFNGFREKILSAATLGLYAGTFRKKALNKISLELGNASKGEIVGIIGPNGAGKSTLLNILSGILKPTAGQIKFQGNVRSILELGVGFHSDLTALENVLYNGILWGYSKKFLLEKKDDLFSFAGLSGFESHPLNTFSTGMQMRLAFSLATLSYADMLLVDEALAVGDASFQQKGVRRFQSFREEGSLVIVVSHDIHMMVSLCDRMILLDQGRIVDFGNPSSVSERYMDLIAEHSHDNAQSAVLSDKNQFQAYLMDSRNRKRNLFFTKERVLFVFEFHSPAVLDQITVGIHINDARGIRVFGTNSRLLKFSGLQIGENETSIFKFSLTLNLGPGKYSAGFSVHRGLSHGTDCFFWEEGILDFEVEQTEEIGFEGISFLEPELKIEKANDASSDES
ncbi:MAG: ATP-binding cassette domain-containing protein [Spirochaetia bacterium]|nr:ATP-binding cassette domain-containing protein [Spirochaetia bacterium]